MEAGQNVIKIEPSLEHHHQHPHLLSQQSEHQYNGPMLALNGHNPQVLVEHSTALLLPLSYQQQQLQLQVQQAQQQLQQHQLNHQHREQDGQNSIDPDLHHQFPLQPHQLPPGISLYNQAMSVKQTDNSVSTTVDSCTTPMGPSSLASSTSSTRAQRWNESPEARLRRLARNAERMRERRARETEDEYRKRLARNAEANRQRRQNENDMERAMRLVRNAARQRLRRAMESPDQRAKRLQKLAERMRLYRATETPEQRKVRLAEMAARARQRIASETPEERKERLRKLNEYAKKVREKRKVVKHEQHLGSASTSSTEKCSNEDNIAPSSAMNRILHHHTLHEQHLQPSLQNAQLSSYQNNQSSNSATPIEYYQNAFISPTSMRSTLVKQEHPNQTTQEHRFINQQQSQQELLESDANTIFQQQLYAEDNDKTPVGTPSPNKVCQTNIHNFGHLASSIEFFQNRYLKKNDHQADSGGEQNNSGSVSLFNEVQSQSKLPVSTASNIESTKLKLTSTQIQNTPSPLYNQFPYLAAIPHHSNTNVDVSSPPTTPTQTTYYPLYHNGFQLGISSSTVPPPFTPLHFPNNTSTVSTPGVTHLSQSTSNSYNLMVNTSQQCTSTAQELTKPSRGRPRKVVTTSTAVAGTPNLKDNDREVPDEKLRQPKVTTLLEHEINQMLSLPQLTPKRGRNQQFQLTQFQQLQHHHHQQQQTFYQSTPHDQQDLSPVSMRSRNRGQHKYETEEEKRIRLDKMAAHQRAIRANESPEQRAARLRKLCERARLKRAEVRASETPEERKVRLAKQAEYARMRRMRTNTPPSRIKLDGMRNAPNIDHDHCNNANTKHFKKGLNPSELINQQLQQDDSNHQHNEPRFLNEKQEGVNHQQSQELEDQHHQLHIQHGHQQQLLQNHRLLSTSMQQKQSPNDVSYVKTAGKEYSQPENNDMLKILEPIIVMKTK